MEILILIALVGFGVYLFSGGDKAESDGGISHSQLRNKTQVVSMQEQETKTYLAGAPHQLGSKSPSAIGVFHAGQHLAAKREPLNQYDRNAIALMLRGRKVGYVPRHLNLKHARHMDNGGSLDVYVTSVDEKDPWHGVSINVKSV